MPAWAAAERPLEDCLSTDVMAVYFGRPSPEMLNAPRGGKVDQLATWLIALKSMGMIPDASLLTADVLGTIPVLWRRPHAIGLLDITSREIAPEVYRLKDLQSVLVIDSAGIETALDRRVRDLLATYTDADHAGIETVEQGGVTFHRLTDRRVPDWVDIDWGNIGRYFVVGVGKGAFERVIDVFAGRAPALGGDAWFRQAHHTLRGSHTGIEVYLDVGRITARLQGPTKNRPAAVLQAMHLEKLDRLVWATGFRGRSVHSEVVGRDIEGADYRVVLAGDELATPEVLAQIPAEASSYTVMRLPLAETFRNLRQAYLESQSPGNRQAIAELWTSLQKKYKFNSEADLLDQLGSHFVIHTYPPHPLGLPLLWTFWIQTAGDTAKIAHTVDAMLTAWQDALIAPRDFTDPNPPKRRFNFTPMVFREDDGIWYLRLGVIGPALAVTDGWIIISYSPEAVRANLTHLQAKNGSRPASTAADAPPVSSN